MTDKNNTSNQSSLTAEAPLKASYTDYEVIPSHGYSLIVKCRKGEQTVILKGRE